MKNSMHYGEIGEMRWPIREGVRKWRIRCIMEKSEKWLAGQGGVRKWRIRCIMVKSEKWLADRGWGQDMENSMHYGEIGEMGWPIRGGQEMENSMHYGEIGEIK